MERDDIEELLANAKYKHLSEETLTSYRDKQLDKIRVAMADAHLRLCLICQRRLENEPELDAMSEADRAAIQLSISKLKAENDAPSISTDIQRLRAYIRELLDAWVFAFAKPATLGSEGDDEIWRYQSDDGLLTAWANLKQDDASLEVHFSSTELAWDGTRIRFRLGPFTKEVTLHRDGDSKVVVAEIRISLEERASDMDDISIEVV